MIRLVILALITGGTALIGHTASLSVKAGLGYEFLSQRYFLDSLNLADPADSTLTIWSLQSTYLDDLKGTVMTSWFPVSDHSLEVQSSLEQTNDFLRLKSGGYWRYRPGRRRFDVEAEFEWRNRFGNAASFGDSYLLGRSRVKGALPIAGSLFGTTRIRMEAVDFRSGTTAAFDYIRVGGSFGLEKTFPNFSWGEVNLIMSTRQVPDSIRMNYTTWGVEGLFFGFLPIGDLDVTARIEYRDYNRPNRQDDSRRLEVYGRNRADFHGWFMRQEFDLEGMLYPAETGLNSDYLRVGGALLAGVQIDDLRIGAGPEVDHLWQRRTPLSDSLGLGTADYRETGAKLDMEYIAAGTFASLESVSGYRSLRGDSPVESSFWYERIYLLGNIRMLEVLNLSILLSAEWEWHEKEQENSKLYLLSSSLTYSF